MIYILIWLQFFSMQAAGIQEEETHLRANIHMPKEEGPSFNLALMSYIFTHTDHDTTYFIFEKGEALFRTFQMPYFIRYTTNNKSLSKENIQLFEFKTKVNPTNQYQNITEQIQITDPNVFHITNLNLLSAFKGLLTFNSINTQLQGISLYDDFITINTQGIEYTPDMHFIKIIHISQDTFSQLQSNTNNTNLVCISYDKLNEYVFTPRTATLLSNSTVFKQILAKHNMQFQPLKTQSNITEVPNESFHNNPDLTAFTDELTLNRLEREGYNTDLLRRNQTHNLNVPPNHPSWFQKFVSLIKRCHRTAIVISCITCCGIWILVRYKKVISS